MKDRTYKKRTQKDYTLNFKLQVVKEIELGELSRTEACHKYGIQAKSTIREWLRKYGNFDWDNQTPYSMSKQKTPEQKLLELEQKICLLEKQNNRLKHLVDQADKKAIIFDMMIALAEKEYNISIRKNSSPEQ